MHAWLCGMFLRPDGTTRCIDSSRFVSQKQDEPVMDMTPHFPIYLDYGATTPVDPRVADAMIPWLREHFGNAASRSHAWGWEAEEAVEKARKQVADLIGADPREIVWTSGATESDNLAIKGAAHFYQGKGKHLITVKTEHKAVLDTMRELERQGFEVSYLDVQENGLLDIEVFKAAIRPDTILASVMAVNNEIGVVQDLNTIGALCRERASSSTSTPLRPRARWIWTCRPCPST
jgi:cysteine desulfurase